MAEDSSYISAAFQKQPKDSRREEGREQLVAWFDERCGVEKNGH